MGEVQMGEVRMGEVRMGEVQMGEVQVGEGKGWRVFVLLLAWGCGAPGDGKPGVSSTDRAEDGGGGVDGSVEDGGADAADGGGAGDGSGGGEGTGDGGGETGGVDGGDGEPREAWLDFLSPVDGATVGNPVRFEIMGEGVHDVALSADGWAIGSGELVDGTFEASYSFSGTGYPRAILAEGYDADGVLAASVSLWVTVTEESTPGVHLGVPYHYQYDNTYEPGATCGITSAAMVLGWWTGAAAPSPDDLYLAYGKAQGQSPSGLAELYGYEGLFGSYTTSGTRDEIIAHLDAGRPVVVHGYWTGSGHIAVIIGYDAADWIVHDPAGDWEVCYGCGGGEAVRYARGGAWDAEMSWDGDVWMSVADEAPF